MTILQLQKRLHESGRIRIGTTVPTDKGRGRPKRLETFRITSQDRRALEQIAHLYGGEVKEWTDAPVGKQWEVITERAELPVAVPPERMALSQSMELWSGGGCVRRCDGERQQDDQPCLCAQLDADDTRTPRCTRHTRLSLMLVELATTGLWRLDTQGFYASEELAGAFELAQMLAQSTGRALLPGWLRLEQREIRRPGEQLKRFPVPVLDLEMQAAALLGPSRVVAQLPDEAKQLGNGTGLTPVPAEQPVSLKEELQRINEPEQRKPRRNAAAPLPSTGIRPRTAAQAAIGDIVETQAHPKPEAADLPAPPVPPVDMPRTSANDPQLRKFFALQGQLGITSREHRLAWCNRHLQRTIKSSSELSGEEVGNLIDALEREADEADEAAKMAAEMMAGKREIADHQEARQELHATDATDKTSVPDTQIPPDQMALANDAAADAAASSETPDDTPDDTPDALPSGTVEMLWFMWKESEADYDWMHDRLQQLGIKDPARQPTKATLRRLTPHAAGRLMQDLSDLIDARSTE